MAKKSYLDRSQFYLLKRCETLGAKDMISLLPDDVLSYIVTKLTLKEAMATSILSKRWKSVWASLPVLDFGCFKLCQFDSYVQRVGNILRQYNGPKLHKFRIFYPVSGDTGPYIDDWISFALRNGVSELELDFHVSGSKSYLPTSVFSLLTTSPNIVKHFDSLRVLCLRSVNLTDEAFDQILCSCVSLERFRVTKSCGLVNAKNNARHMKLKSLEFYYCCDLEKLELLAPNLVSFKYHGRERTLCIKDAQKLASLRLSTVCSEDPNTSLNFPRGKDFIFSQFSSYIHKLEFLHLSVHLIKDMNDFTALYVFSNLKHLMLDVSNSSLNRLGYLAAASILRVSPYLEQLELKLPPINYSKYANQALELGSMSPHQKLKEVKLFGFRGCANTMEFLTYLIRYAVSLEKIDVTARGAANFGDKLIVFPLNVKADAKLCMECMVQLHQILHQNVQLLFRDYEQCLDCISNDDHSYL